MSLVLPMVVTNPYECMGSLGTVIARRVCTYMILLLHPMCLRGIRCTVP